MRHILFCAQDPGGANAILPVILKAAEDEKISYDVLAAEHAVEIFQKRKMKKLLDCTCLSFSDLKKFYSKVNPRVVLLGTSEGYSLEKKVTRIARQHGTKTVSVIDSWMDYAKRYSSSTNPGDLKYLPDIVCVNDEFAKRGAIREGIEPEVIKITGNPHVANSVKKIKRTRGKYARFNLLFVSQPLRRGKISQYSLVRDLYNFPLIGRFHSITIRPHPKEGLVKKYTGKGRGAVHIDRDTDIYKLINNSGLIIGISSIILFECAMSGEIVISYQPRTRSSGDESFINNKLDLSYNAYNKEDFYALLEQYTAGTLKPLSNTTKYRKKLIVPEAAGNILRILKNDL